MKTFALVALSALVLNLSAVAAPGSSLKTEGSCSGSLADGTPVTLTYYSDFDGCKNVSQSAVTFHSGIEGLFTGSRSFKGGRDNYSFSQHRLSFADSTGNTSGELSYRDQNDQKQVVTLQCEVRDYSYGEC